MDTLDVKYTEMVRTLPYFKRHRGRDHIFTFGSGLSASVFRSWRSEIPESIQLSPETWLFNDVVDMKEPCFDTWRDIAVPGYLHRHEILSLSQAAKPLADRSRLAVFLGRIDSSRGPHPSQGGPDVRAAIRRLKEKGKIFVAQNLSFPEMHAVMGSAKFCFVPKGRGLGISADFSFGKRIQKQNSGPIFVRPFIFLFFFTCILGFCCEIWVSLNHIASQCFTYQIPAR